MAQGSLETPVISGTGPSKDRPLHESGVGVGHALQGVARGTTLLGGAAIEQLVDPGHGNEGTPGPWIVGNAPCFVRSACFAASSRTLLNRLTWVHHHEGRPGSADLGCR